MKRTLVTLSVAAALATPMLAQAAVSYSGDVRLGYFANERVDRDGSESSTGDWRARIRAGALWQASETVSAKARWAGRYSAEDNDFNFELFEAMPSSGGLRFGDSTLDELHLRYRPSAAWDHRVGRFQTRANLAGVAGKSLSRNDSSNTAITWTDGLHSRYRSQGGWDYHLILQRSTDEGPTTIRHSPLAFDESASHITYYLGMAKQEREGRFLQRGWDVTYIPESLQTDGSPAGPIDDYLAVTGRLALQWPLGGGSKFIWGAELGYAPNTQTNASMNLPGTGDVGGTAFQTSLNLMDFAPGHSIGLVYGQAEAGWLLSTDYSPNRDLVELRYRWRPVRAHTFHARIRVRDELEQRIGAAQTRKDTDYYLRYTYNF